MTKLIDEIIEGALSGDREQFKHAASLYEEKFSVEKFREEEAICLGILVPHSVLEFDADLAARFEEAFPEDRLAELASGQEPTAEERALYRQLWIEQAEAGETDFDLVPAFRIHPLIHTDGRELFAVSTVFGYSFTGVYSTLHGFARSVEAALRGLEQLGVLVDVTHRRKRKSRKKS